MGIEAVTFDVGGTLIKPWPGVGEIYSRIASKHGVTCPSAVELDKRFAEAWHGLSNFNYTRDGWEQLVRHVFEGVTGSIDSFFPSLYDHFASAQAWHVFDDVIPTLDRLASEGLQLAVVSNWDERLRPLLKDLHLESYLDAIIVSSEVGFHKPSPVIFEHAARKLGRKPGSILHVGDSHEMDVMGARHAGFRALQLCRDEGVAKKREKISSLMQIDPAAF